MITFDENTVARQVAESQPAGGTSALVLEMADYARQQEVRRKVRAERLEVAKRVAKLIAAAFFAGILFGAVVVVVLR